MCWIVDAMASKFGQLIEIWRPWWPFMVIEDVFVVVESLVKNQCKGKPYNFLPFSLLPPFFFQLFYSFFSPSCVGNKSMVLSVLIGVREALV